MTGYSDSSSNEKNSRMLNRFVWTRQSESAQPASRSVYWFTLYRVAALVALICCGSYGTTACAAEEPTATHPDFAAICEHAAVQASRATGVPLSVLKAISLTETGRKSNGVFRPWPWTVNMEGKGFWFDGYDEALAFARGARSFDIGCFQINYKWHHEAFTSIEHMFEPLANALYAAEFLRSLYQQKGSWGAAAGAYHSLNPVHAKPYQARFETIRARFAPEDGLPLPDVSDAELAAATGGVDPALRQEVIRINTFPLLQGGTQGLMGSLVSPDAAAGLSLLASSNPAQSLFAGPDTAEAVATPVEDPEPPADEADLPIPELGAIY
jgi:Transglycosylase SLT domain